MRRVRPDELDRRERAAGGKSAPNRNSGSPAADERTDTHGYAPSSDAAHRAAERSFSGSSVYGTQQG